MKSEIRLGSVEIQCQIQTANNKQFRISKFSDCALCTDIFIMKAACRPINLAADPQDSNHSSAYCIKGRKIPV